MTLQLSAGFRDSGHGATVAAPAEMEVLQRARSAQLDTVVIQAPPGLLRFGGALLSGSPAAKLRFISGTLVPYNFTSAVALRRLRTNVVYAAQERSVLQIGLGARAARIPVVWHAQGGLKRGSRRLHLTAARLATRIICVSAAVADDLNAILGPAVADKLEVIHNGLPDVAVRPGADPVRRIILFAGSVVPEKGVHHLVTAFIASAATRDCELHIAGPCIDPRYGEYLRHLAVSAGAADRVLLLGFRDDIPELMASSTVVACPSVERERLSTPFGTWEMQWKEGFCLAALEGMRAGKPVVGSDTGGLREVVSTDESGLLVPPGNAAALAAALTSVLDDPELARSLGENGRRRFEDRFRAEIHIRRFTSALIDVGNARTN